MNAAAVRQSSRRTARSDAWPRSSPRRARPERDALTRDATGETMRDQGRDRPTVQLCGRSEPAVHSREPFASPRRTRVRNAGGARGNQHLADEHPGYREGHDVGGGSERRRDHVHRGADGVVQQIEYPEHVEDPRERDREGPRAMERDHGERRQDRRDPIPPRERYAPLRRRGPDARKSASAPMWRKDVGSPPRGAPRAAAARPAGTTCTIVTMIHATRLISMSSARSRAEGGMPAALVPEDGTGQRRRAYDRCIRAATLARPAP